jgi:hypothetical protein
VVEQGTHKPLVGSSTLPPGIDAPNHARRRRPRSLRHLQTKDEDDHDDEDDQEIPPPRILVLVIVLLSSSATTKGM